MGGKLPLLCKTRSFKLFHEFNVGNHPILMGQNLRKKFTQIQGLCFPMFFIKLC